jgi:site-specific DNA-methyltransferase (adenine-specific)
MTDNAPTAAPVDRLVRLPLSCVPYYEKDGVTIYNADCLQVLHAVETATVDAVITDPPYCSGGSLESQKNTPAQGLRTATVQAEGFEWFSADNMSTAGLVFLVRATLVAARRFLKPNRSAFVFTDWRMIPNIAPALESSGLRYRNMIVWDKGHAGLGCGFKPAHEVLLEFSNGATEYQKLTGQNVIRCSRVHASDRKHNAEKPVKLIEEVIGVAVPEGGLVVDPFMGSGSVLAACVAMGCRYVGCELEERFCEIAANRLRQGVLW